jgi:hypothetical protein
MPRNARSNREDATIRLRTARAYLEVAELVLGESTREEFLSVAAGLAVLAGIAASDAVCGARLALRHRGEDHRGAADLLATATPDGRDLANKLRRLLDVKDEAQYGVIIVSAARARAAVRSAGSLVARAAQELER